MFAALTGNKKGGTQFLGNFSLINNYEKSMELDVCSDSVKLSSAAQLMDVSTRRLYAIMVWMVYTHPEDNVSAKEGYTAPIENDFVAFASDCQALLCEPVLVQLGSDSKLATKSTATGEWVSVALHQLAAMRGKFNYARALLEICPVLFHARGTPTLEPYEVIVASNGTDKDVMDLLTFVRKERIGLSVRTLIIIVALHSTLEATTIKDAATDGKTMCLFHCDPFISERITFLTEEEFELLYDNADILPEHPEKLTELPLFMVRILLRTDIACYNSPKHGPFIVRLLRWLKLAEQPKFVDEIAAMFKKHNSHQLFSFGQRYDMYATLLRYIDKHGDLTATDPVVQLFEVLVDQMSTMSSLRPESIDPIAAQLVGVIKRTGVTAENKHWLVDLSIRMLKRFIDLRIMSPVRQFPVSITNKEHTCIGETTITNELISAYCDTRTSLAVRKQISDTLVHVFEYELPGGLPIRHARRLFTVHPLALIIEHQNSKLLELYMASAGHVRPEPLPWIPFFIGCLKPETIKEADEWVDKIEQLSAWLSNNDIRRKKAIWLLPVHGKGMSKQLQLIKETIIPQSNDHSKREVYEHLYDRLRALYEGVLTFTK